MSKQLILAEKPSVGKEIARVLGCNEKKNGYCEGKNAVVTWALGHLVTLADPDIYDKRFAKWDLEDLPIMPNHMKLVVIKQTGKQFSTVKNLMLRKDINEIVIATDAGREGELVARWIIEKLGVKKSIKRLWISSITDKAIKDGFKNLKAGSSYENLYRAAVARAEGDWLVGINATRALTTKYNAQLSCGRVQTPTLAIIGNREEVIRKFESKKFYGINAVSNKLKLKWHDSKSNDSNTFNKEKIETLLSKLKSNEAVVTSIEKKHKKTFAPHLYDLTELQRDAHNRYGYSAKYTLSTMQKLYEHHKVLTYPRTDSRFITTDMVDTLGERLRAINVDPYRASAFKLQKTSIKASKNFVDNSKVTDHHAIIPTEDSPILSELSYEERNIYELVVKRFIEVLMPAFEYEETTLNAAILNEKFTAKGKRILNMGWKSLDGTLAKDDMLPEINKGDKLKIKNLDMTSGETSPPSYFNEATLLTAMESPGKYMKSNDKELKNILGETGGLGTVATRADIIEKLFRTNVVELKGKSIHITSKGKQLLEIAPSELKSPKLTAEWESKFSDIASGKLNPNEFKKEMRIYTQAIISDIKKSETKFKHDNLTTTKCPECGKLMMEVKTKHGKSLVCQDRECGFRKSISKVTNARCPECHVKMFMFGEGEGKTFTCKKCGYKEKLTSWNKRKDAQGSKMNKNETRKYLEQMKANEKEEAFNNPFAALLKDYNK